MTLPTPIIKIVNTRPLFESMLSALEDEMVLAVDTETVGMSTLPIFGLIEEARRRWYSAARAHILKFKKSEGKVKGYYGAESSAKGYVGSRANVRKLSKEVEKTEKSVYKELSGLHFWESYLGCIQIGLEDGLCYMIRPEILTPSDKEILGKFLNSRRTLLFANAVFDIKMLYAHTGILLDGRRLFDVQVAEWALENGKQYPRVKTNLKHLVKKYAKFELSKDAKVRISNWLGPWDDQQLQYAAYDVIGLFPVWKAQRTQLIAWQLTEAVKLRNEFATVAAILDMSGIPIDIPKLQKYRSELEQLRRYQDMDLRIQLEVDDEFNLNSTQQLHACLTRHGLILEDTNEKTMKLAYAGDARIEALLEYRGTQKLIQIVDKYLNFSRDGRIYSQFRHYATGTGRLASGNDSERDKDPWYVNGQNPPKGFFRECIAPRKGRKFINADYSQIELRWNAQLANDPVMIDAYKRGEDLHKITGASVAGVDMATFENWPKEKQKDYRQRAKAVNFGLLFGAGWATLKNYAKIQYDVELTDEEAQESRKAWKALYSATADYQRYGPHKVKEAGLVRTASGLIRWFPWEAYTDSLNTPVQGSAADGFMNGLNILVYGLLDDGFVPFVDFWLPTVVHDETLLETVDEYAEEMRFRVEDSMIRGMEKYLKVVPVEVEAKVIDNWSEKD